MFGAMRARSRWLGLGLGVVACGGPASEADTGTVRDAAAVRADAAEDAAPTTDAASAPDASTPRRTFVYVGLTSGDLVTLDGDTLAERSRTRTGNFPSFVAATADGAHLFVVHEGANELAAVDVSPDGTTTVGARRSAPGGPTHVALDPSESHVLVASYGDGHVYGYGVSSGALTAGPTDNAVCGSHAHQVVFDATGAFALVPCLGDDAVRTLAHGTGEAWTETSHASTARGAGPRHVALSAEGRFAYVLDELGSTLDVFSVASGGALSPVQTISTLPGGFSGTNACAEVLLSPDGAHVYASNRGHDSVAVFARDATTGRVTLVEREPVGGQHPRSMTLARGGTQLYVAARDSDLVAIFDVAADGSLTPVRTLSMPGHPYFIGEFAAP